MDGLAIQEALHRLADRSLVRRRGRVVQVVGTVVEAEAPAAAVGELARIGDAMAEVVGFRDERVLLMPIDPPTGVGRGTAVELYEQELRIPVGDGLLGRIVDPLGRPLDGVPLTGCAGRRPLEHPAPPPLARERIRLPMPTGIRAIDGLVTLGEGQRIAVMAGSGVGKSTLLGMVARHSACEVNVVALVGERGREVREFLERDLGPEGLARSVVVVATSDASPVLQVKAVLAALAVAEHFRDEGRRVMLMVDSLTRLAMAQRQIGLAAGEPPATRGYTPSVFALLPRLLERAGQGTGRGSITAVCTVLVEGDDMDDPIADTVRGIVDGHIVLSRRLASLGHYPPIDVLQSLSRTMKDTVSAQHLAHAGRVRALLATWAENEELIRLGAYKRGTDAAVDEAIDRRPEIEAFLRQRPGEHTDFGECLDRLARIARPAAQRGAGGRSRSAARVR